jgi:hypothetical protein
MNRCRKVITRLLRTVGSGLAFLVLSVCFLNVPAQGAVNPVPFINQPLIPTSAVPGGAGFTLTINGTGFVSNSVANWNGSPRTTAFVNHSQLTVTIPASDIANAGTESITVTNPAPGGGISNVMYFGVSSPASSLAFAALNSLVQSGPLLAADFNGDGKIDLVIGTVGINSGLCVELGVGDGSFQSPICPTNSTGATALIAADFNGDGKLDLAGVDLNGVHTWLGNGDGTFQPEQTFLLAPVDQPEAWSLAAADFNNDGKLDLVVGSVNNGSPGMISILLGNGDGTFQPPINYGSGEYFAVAVGDFNGDGNLDVASAGVILLGNGDGTFQQQSGQSSGAIHMIAADVNGDGKIDLVYEIGGAGLFVQLGTGAGTFQTAVNIDSNAPNGLVAADFNGDGKLDLAVGSNSNPGSDSILLGNGDGTFQTPIDFSTVEGDDLVAADFNGDGKTDLAFIGSQPFGLNLTVFLQGAWPALTPGPPNLIFAQQNIGTASAPQTITLTNTGTSSLTISSISVSGPNAGDFAQTNNCGPTLGANANCQVNVTFTPAANGVRNASLIVADNAAGSPQVLPLFGSTPPAAVVTVSPTSITFPSQYVGTSGLPQNVTVTNTGTATLNITGVTASTSDFGTLSGCGSSLAIGASCQIGVFFDPTKSGTRSGTLTITDDGLGSPQNVNISGMGQDFSLGASQSSQTINPGQTASYTVTLSPAGGFSQSVALSCSGAPAQSTCTVSPSSVTLTGASSTAVSVIVGTMSSGVPGPGWGGFRRFVPVNLGLLAFVLLASLWLKCVCRQPSRRPALFCCSALFLVCVAMLVAACGGGSGSTKSGVASGTYSMTVTGTFGTGSTTLSHNLKLSLVVK